MAVPTSISAPMAGMWWSDIDGRWIETNLDIEAEHIMSWPPDDTDLLGEAATEGESSKDTIGNGTVEFQVNHDANESAQCCLLFPTWISWI